MRIGAAPAKHATVALALIVVGLACTAAHAGDQAYRVKLTDIAIPDGASLGEVRRSFQPFPNWTLICDENLKARTKICNVTQSFVDVSGAVIFSWSLAATEDGSPVFILRAPASLVGPKSAVTVEPVAGKPLSAIVQGCDDSICVATLPLDRRLTDQIARAEPVRISYGSHPDAVTLSAPLNGLARALAASE